MQNQIEEPHILLRLFGPLLLLALTIFAIVAFPVEVYSNFRAISQLPISIEINKGDYYLLGAGLTVGIFSYITILELWFKVQLKRKVVAILLKVAIAGLFLAFILPHSAHALIGSHLSSKGYILCQEASRRWLHSVKLVYAQNEEACRDISNNSL